MKKLLHYTSLVTGTGDEPVEIKEDEVYCDLVQSFRDDILGVKKSKLGEMFKDEEFMLKHHEVFHYAKQTYDLDNNNFKKGLKEFKFVD